MHRGTGNLEKKGFFVNGDELEEGFVQELCYTVAQSMLKG